MQVPDNAIQQAQASVEIDASPDAVWAMVSDITRMGEWSPEATGGRWLPREDGGLGDGSVGDWFEGNNRVGEREWSRECQVARAEPGRDFTFVVGGVEENCTWWSYECEPTASGTKLTERWWIVNFTPGMLGATPEQRQDRFDVTPPMLIATVNAVKQAAENA
ncbi:MAG: hypothetical protein ACI8Y4_005100 [Candidatus Poriferisodalaceae bacterium]|jgi:hypothetical protein